MIGNISPFRTNFGYASATSPGMLTAAQFANLGGLPSTGILGIANGGTGASTFLAAGLPTLAADNTFAGANTFSYGSATITAATGTAFLVINANTASNISRIQLKAATNERAYIQYDDGGSSMRIDSDGSILLAPNNTTAQTLGSDLSTTIAGKIITQSGVIRKVRVALTTPITGAVTDDIIVAKLTTPAAVALALPAGATGQVIVIKDGTGDAAANNITITPAAGTIDGAGTFVMATNYQSVRLVYNGTQWNAI